MTAMVVDNGLVICQRETSSKTNEIPVMQAMLANKEVKGAVITADAMHCQKQTAQAIRQGQADYMLQVKSNQGNLLKEIQAYYHKIRRDNPALIEANRFTEVSGEHGVISERAYCRLPITDWFNESNGFIDSFAVIEVERKRNIKGKESHETSYYMTSLQDDTENLAGYIRRHWAIENSQHWVLDVVFREDECQIYAEDGAKNLATLRRGLLNMVKQHPLKDSVAGKMQRACWDGKFRAEILFG